MRFLLVEANVKVSPEIISAWNKAPDLERRSMIKQVIKDSGLDPNKYVNPEALRYATFQMGIDPNKNPLIDLFFDLQSAGKKLKHEYLTTIVDLYQTNRIDVSREWFRDLSEGLYDRTLEEFKYTINILDVVADERKLSKYFKDPKLVNFDELYDDSGKLKPAGNKSTADDLSTIFGTVESWAGADGENEVEQVKSKPKNPKQVKLTAKEKDHLKSKGYGSFDDFPDDEKSDGALAYFKVPKEGTLSPDEFINNWRPGFYMYNAKRNAWMFVSE